MAVNKAELAKHLGVSKWQITKHLKNNNVVDPRYLNVFLKNAFKSAKSLNDPLLDFKDSLKKVINHIGQEGSHNNDIKHLHFKNALNKMIQAVNNANDPYNKELLKQLHQMRKDINQPHRQASLQKLSSKLNGSLAWWQLLDPLAV